MRKGTTRKNVVRKHWRIAAVSAVVVLTAAVALVLRGGIGSNEPPPYWAVDCAAEQPDDFDCWRDLLRGLVLEETPAAAFEEARVANDNVPFFASFCHQFLHEIGRAAGERYGTVGDAFAEGDDLCASGYYHGVMEAIALLIGKDEMISQVDTMCTPIKDGSGAYSLDHYNCAHGLGHGLFAVTLAQLFEALDACDGFADGWEATSCHSGVFMENIMAEDNPHHATDYLRPDEPLYPCTEVDTVYKNPCYLIQSSYALRIFGYDYEATFEACEVEPDFAATCWQSIGRDVSGFSGNNVAQTIQWCMLGHTGDVQLNCFIGAAKDYVYHLQDDARALELCAAIEDQQTSAACTNEVHTFYASIS